MINVYYLHHMYIPPSPLSRLQLWLNRDLLIKSLCKLHHKYDMLYVDYTQYSFYVKCSRLKKAYFVALSNTRMLSQMCNQTRHIYGHTKLRLWMSFCVLQLFLLACVLRFRGHNWTAHDHHNVFSTKYIFFLMYRVLAIVSVMPVCLFAFQWSFCDGKFVHEQALNCIQKEWFTNDC